MSLEDDIRQAAARRGRTAPEAADYVTRARETLNYQRQDLPAAARVLTADQVRFLFNGHKDAASAFRDLHVFDLLPPASREFIRECPHQVNAANYLAALNHVRNEKSLIELMQAVTPLQMSASCERKYGRGHPQVGTRDFSLTGRRRRHASARP